MLAIGECGGRPISYGFTLRAEGANVIDMDGDSIPIRFPTTAMEELPREMVVSIQRGQYPLDWDDLECESSSPVLGVSLKPTSKDKWDLHLTVSQSGVLGSCRVYARFSFLKSGNRVDYHYERPVDVSIDGPVMATPASVVLGVLKKGETVTKTVEVSLRSESQVNTSFAIRSVSSTDPCMIPQIRQEGNRRMTGVSAV